MKLTSHSPCQLATSCTLLIRHVAQQLKGCAAPSMLTCNFNGQSKRSLQLAQWIPLHILLLLLLRFLFLRWVVGFMTILSKIA